MFQWNSYDLTKHMKKSFHYFESWFCRIISVKMDKNHYSIKTSKIQQKGGYLKIYLFKILCLSIVDFTRQAMTPHLHLEAEEILVMPASFLEAVTVKVALVNVKGI